MGAMKWQTSWRWSEQMTSVFDGILDLALAAMVFTTVALFLCAILDGGQGKAGILEKRLRSLGPGTSEARSSVADVEARAQDELQKALSDLDALRRKQHGFFLVRLLKNAGSERSVMRHLLLSLGLGAGIGFGLVLLKVPLHIGAALGVGLGLGSGPIDFSLAA